MTDQQIAQGIGPTPSTITVQGSQQLLPKLAFAAFDGTGAAGDFLPVIKFIGPSGLLAGQAVGDVVTAGASVDQTWFRGLAKSAAPQVIKVFDVTLTGSGTFHAAKAFKKEFNVLEAHIWAKVPTATYAGVPPTIRARFMSLGAVRNNWRLLAAGSFANISASGEEVSSAVGYAPQLANTADRQAAYSYTVVRWFNYQSQLGYKQWISDGITFDQTFAGAGVPNFVNRWTGGGWMEGTPYPGAFGSTDLFVYPNANPSATAGQPDAGKFATGSRLLVLGYIGA